MANRTYDFEITWCWKEDGNRPDNIADITAVRSTTVNRAVGKLVRQLNEQEGLTKEDENFIRASDLLVIDVRNHKLTSAIIAHKRGPNGDSAN